MHIFIAEGIYMEQSEQKIEITARRDMSLTGVKEVKEFSDTRVILKTDMGSLVIRGKKLNISRLNTDTGALYVTGELESLRYTSPAGGGIIEGLFK